MADPAHCPHCLRCPCPTLPLHTHPRSPTPAPTQALRATMFNPDSGAPTRATMQQYYATCSYGKLNYLAPNNLITTVELPCT